LKETRAKLSDDGFRIVNVDATVVCEAPRLADYIDDMINTISDTLNVDRNRISVKASSSNGVGPLGKGAGIAAYAVSLIDETR
jgi:2-C-methyl-D-erythritol 2,4-cyclodiphosphate synthase